MLAHDERRSLPKRAIMLALAAATFVTIFMTTPLRYTFFINQGSAFATLFGFLALVVANVVVCIVGCARASDLRPPANPPPIPFVR